ncbi:MAG: M20/M25/M40 family metallo-hydrolase [Acidobacteriaceae bacterium]|nr:M20/M25/M40 family metallo-hydrolase [Acidobacteriaceae bacterium]MBV9500943.1 M20/M25/M40 family metallo-hydrolase [Acidobacteriaceae bacterium]
MLSRRTAFVWGAAALVPLFLVAEENVDLLIVNRIKAEAFSNSKVMDTMFFLTDVYGPRLTNSPNYKAAGDWAVKRLQEYGLVNVKEEKWGPFGRGWANKYYEARMIEPQVSPLIGIPLAWTSGTKGSITGEPILAPIRTEADIEKFKGKLRGKIVMMSEVRELPFPTEVEGHRYTDAELVSEVEAPEPGRTGLRAARAPGNSAGPPMSREERIKLQEKIRQFLHDEGALMVLQASRGDGGTIFAQSGGPYQADKPVAIPGVVLMPEQYNRIARLTEHNIPVKLEFNIQNEFYGNSPDCFNIVGEIPGTGPHKDEVVMLGAHFDSWHGGTGATDNGAGSAVMIEAVRILKALNVSMDRTVRIALWGGEEEGLLGSKAYVKEHFGDPKTMKLTADQGKLSGYFNYDNGTGKIRGVYLQGNDMMRPIFEAWFAPFKDLGASTISIRNTGGTDHLSFDAVGLPGFQFIQDPMDYETRTHHSDLDVYDRIQPGDLMQASAIIASFVYNTATRPDMLPRKPLPKPEPESRPRPSVE